MKRILIGLLIVTAGYLILYFLSKDLNRTLFLFANTITSSLIISLLFVLIYRSIKKTEKKFIDQFGNVLVFLVVPIIVIILLGQLVTNRANKAIALLNKQNTNKTISYIDNLPKLADEINQNCPKQIDSSTTLMGVDISLKDTVFNFNFKILTFTKDEKSINALKVMTDELNKKTIIEDSSLQNLLKNKVNISFSYYDMNSILMFKLNYP